MANLLNLTNLCYQRKQQMLFNVPLPRYTPISPYPKYTQAQLDMRRKAEILKYSSNTSNSQTNLLTRKEKWSKISNAKYSGSVLFCPDDISIPTLTSACDVPGPIMYLFNDKNIPLYKFVSQTNTYGINNGINTINWSTIYNDNTIVYSNTESAITTLCIKNNDDISQLSFNIKTPFSVFIAGNNISSSGPFDITKTIISVSVITYYSGNEVLAFNGVPTYSYTTMATPINITLIPPDNTTNFSYSAFVYSGILNLSNINLNTENGYIYDIKLKFNYNISSSNSSNASIINNTIVIMYTNLSSDFYQTSVDGMNPMNNVPNPYNCTITSGVSNDVYSKPQLNA